MVTPTEKWQGKLAVCLFFPKGRIEGVKANFLGAQASLPGFFGKSVIAGNPAGKDACAPRKFALPSRRDFHSFSASRLNMKAP
jgi:hypothetical protein